MKIPYPRFTVLLGNVQRRPGHRHDCAQLELAVHVRAPDADAAREAVAELAKVPLEVRAPGCPWPMTLQLNRANLGSRSLRVFEGPDRWPSEVTS